MGLYSRLLLLCLAALALSSCASGGSTTAPPEPDASAQAVNTYLIGVDDQLQITVWHNPDLSVSVPVRPDGKITVPLIGDVVAGGQTPEQVSEEIRAKLQSYVRDPQVAVILTELRSNEYLSRVRVTGAVRTPISIPYRQGMTVLDAVLAAGGVTEFAAPDRTQLFRKGEGGTTKKDSQCYIQRCSFLSPTGTMSLRFRSHRFLCPTCLRNTSDLLIYPGKMR